MYLQNQIRWQGSIYLKMYSPWTQAPTGGSRAALMVTPTTWVTGAAASRCCRGKGRSNSRQEFDCLLNRVVDRKGEWNKLSPGRSFPQMSGFSAHLGVRFQTTLPPQMGSTQHRSTRGHPFPGKQMLLLPDRLNSQTCNSILQELCSLVFQSQPLSAYSKGLVFAYSAWLIWSGYKKLLTVPSALATHCTVYPLCLTVFCISILCGHGSASIHVFNFLSTSPTLLHGTGHR